jgi:hypothetical protein
MPVCGGPIAGDVDVCKREVTVSRSCAHYADRAVPHRRAVSLSGCLVSQSGCRGTGGVVAQLSAPRSEASLG